MRFRLRTTPVLPQPPHAEGLLNIYLLLFLAGLFCAHHLLADCRARILRGKNIGSCPPARKNPGGSLRAGRLRGSRLVPPSAGAVFSAAGSDAQPAARLWPET